STARCWRPSAPRTTAISSIRTCFLSPRQKRPTSNLAEALTATCQPRENGRSALQLAGSGIMAGQLQEFEVLAPDLVVDPATGNATIIAVTTKGVIRLSLAGEVLLLLRDRIAKKLAEARHGSLYMLPAVTGCHGLGTSISRSQLQLRLVLED